MNTKQQYRQEALNRRRALPPEERIAASTQIRNVLLLQLEQLNPATAPLLIYRSMKDEVDTRPLLTTDRPLMFTPASYGAEIIQWHETTQETRWKTGKFGVEEPVSGRLWKPEVGKAVLICPLVGFDRSGNRLGLGMGCFDRWLERFGTHLLTTIGLAFTCQEVPAIQIESHDVPLDTIITEQEVIQCRNS